MDRGIKTAQPFNFLSNESVLDNNYKVKTLQELDDMLKYCFQGRLCYCEEDATLYIGTKDEATGVVSWQPFTSGNVEFREIVDGEIYGVGEYVIYDYVCYTVETMFTGSDNPYNDILMYCKPYIALPFSYNRNFEIQKNEWTLDTTENLYYYNLTHNMETTDVHYSFYNGIGGNYTDGDRLWVAVEIINENETKFWSDEPYDCTVVIDPGEHEPDISNRTQIILDHHRDLINQNIRDIKELQDLDKDGIQKNKEDIQLLKDNKLEATIVTNLPTVNIKENMLYYVPVVKNGITVYYEQYLYRNNTWLKQDVDKFELKDFQANTDYFIDDLIVYNYNVYKVIDNFTSGATWNFDTTKLTNYIGREFEYNRRVLIPAADWTIDNTSKLYTYTLVHNANSLQINYHFSEKDTGLALFIATEEIDENTTRFYSDTNKETYVVLDVGCYATTGTTGTPDLTAIYNRLRNVEILSRNNENEMVGMRTDMQTISNTFNDLNNNVLPNMENEITNLEQRHDNEVGDLTQLPNGATNIVDAIKDIDTRTPAAQNQIGELGRLLTDDRDTLVNAINEVLLRTKNVWELIYPVGSIYMSIEATSPEDLFGGTWERIAQGRCLIGEGSLTDYQDGLYGNTTTTYNAGSQGGTRYSVLSINQVPAHTHTASTNSTGSHSHSYVYPQKTNGFPDGGNDTGGSYGYWRYTTTASTGSGGSHSHTVTVSNAGGYNSTTTLGHSNMQPYLVVYMWKRIA